MDSCTIYWPPAALPLPLCDVVVSLHGGSPQIRISGAILTGRARTAASTFNCQPDTVIIGCPGQGRANIRVQERIKKWDDAVTSDYFGARLRDLFCFIASTEITSILILASLNSTLTFLNSES